MSKLNEYVRSLDEAIQPSPVIRTYEIHIDRKTEDLAYINAESLPMNIHQILTLIEDIMIEKAY